MSVLDYPPYYTVLGSIGMVAVVLLGLRKALTRGEWPPEERSRIMRVAAGGLIGWFLVTAALAWLGAYHGASVGVPTIQFGVLVPVVAGTYLIWRSTTVSRIIDAVPQQWLVGVQLYRVLGAIFVVLYAAGTLPGLFALPAGLGDMAVGLAAPWVAWRYAAAPADNARRVRTWNVLGLTDFVIAIATGFFTTPSPLQLFAFEAPNVLIDAFPLVLIPVFLVPLSILLHFASLTKLRREHASRSHPTGAAPASA